MLLLIVSAGHAEPQVIRHQYTLGYISNRVSQPGIYHSLRVLAHGPDRQKLLVRARAGYIGGGEKVAK